MFISKVQVKEFSQTSHRHIEIAPKQTTQEKKELYSGRTTPWREKQLGDNFVTIC